MSVETDLLNDSKRKHLLRLLKGWKTIPPSTARWFVQHELAFRSTMGVGYYLTTKGKRLAEQIKEQSK